MSNKTQLQTNNTKLDSLIETLRGKAAGGSGGSGVDTCTVEISFNSSLSWIYSIIYQYLGEDNKSQCKHLVTPIDYIGTTQSFTVVCGSLFFVGAQANDLAFKNTAGGIENITGDYAFLIFQTPEEKDAVGTVTVYDAD